MAIQVLCPFILNSTVIHFLFGTSGSSPWHPVIWLIAMLGVALFKSFLAMLIVRDPWLLLFNAYGFIYFFGPLPSKIYALVTMDQTGWCASAQSSSEHKHGQLFVQRSFHICHLVIWYLAVFTSLGFFVARLFKNPLYFLSGVFALIPSAFLYWQRPTFLPKLFKKKQEDAPAAEAWKRRESPDFIL